ncbi:U32 family peptidase [Magnetospirillum sp. 15-1]|uniref:U32 family peptidase n=1 Tax=Magnetospirillum sp. 15-1 TaxID=1979370 RepID=UPI000BBBA8ED|nr:U32 family peptidase [Magnetospirillum sp. 15-1]
MKIVAPISRVEEVEPLAKAGAAEIYCGIVPPEWTERFRSSGANRRAFGNLSSYDDLAAVIDLADRHEVAVSLVMNAQHYGEAQTEALLDMAGRFAELGGRSLIVGDVGLLSRLGRAETGLRLHASSLLACRNGEAAGFLGDLGACRVVFPRDLTLAEMKAVAGANRPLEFEAFILNDGCVFEEGNCHTIHLPGRLGGPICLDRYDAEHRRVDGRPLRDDEAAGFAANDAAHAEWLWYRFSCGFSVSQDGYPFGPCGLCAIPDLAAAGVSAIKIAGREGNLERKVNSVAMVKAALDRLNDAAGLRRFARDLRGRPDLCETGFMCYYRETMPARVW